MINFTAIDFETANPKRASACSIGMARVREGKVVERFYSLLKPEPCDFNYINTAIHGISSARVANAPTFLELWDDISAFIGNDVLVAHNVSFEQSVINQTMRLYDRPIPEFDYLCTLYMCRVSYPRRQSYKLDDVLKDLLGQSVNHHHALEDAVACAELGVHLIQRFPSQPLSELMGALYETPVRQKKEWERLSGTKPSKEELDPNHPLFDKRMAMTGQLSSMSREKAVQFLVDSGGIYQDHVTKATNFLLVGDEEKQVTLFGNKSVKARKAEEYNAAGLSIQLLSEKEFLALVVQ